MFDKQNSYVNLIKCTFTMNKMVSLQYFRQHRITENIQIHNFQDLSANIEEKIQLQVSLFRILSFIN